VFLMCEIKCNNLYKIGFYLVIMAEVPKDPDREKREDERKSRLFETAQQIFPNGHADEETNCIYPYSNSSDRIYINGLDRWLRVDARNKPLYESAVELLKVYHQLPGENLGYGQEWRIVPWRVSRRPLKKVS